MDEWTELNPYAIKHPDGGTIAKYAQPDGSWKYLLCRGDAMNGFFDSPDAAKAEFDRLSLP